MQVRVSRATVRGRSGGAVSFQVPEGARVTTGDLATDRSAGNNGAFVFASPIPRRRLWVIASDGAGWEHVSVSVLGQPKKTPTWLEMCAAKDAFWDEEDTVIQIHPPRSCYVNFHPGCLHMWRSSGEAFGPVPPPALVGPVGVESGSIPVDQLPSLTEEELALFDGLGPGFVASLLDGTLERELRARREAGSA